jgi:hypothetical protein
MNLARQITPNGLGEGEWIMKRPIKIGVTFIALTVGALATGGITGYSVAAKAQMFNKADVCKSYSDTAILAFVRGSQIPACQVTRQPRWHDVFRLHFDWCMGGGDIQAEAAARDAVLSGCDPLWKVKLN